MKVEPNESLILRVTCSSVDTEREFDITINGQKITEHTLNQAQNRNLVDVDYKLPPELLKDKNKVTVKFSARANKATGGVFEIRVLKEKK